jgi:hypothetical protein
LIRVCPDNLTIQASFLQRFQWQEFHRIDEKTGLQNENKVVYNPTIAVTQGALLMTPHRKEDCSER